jgi:hypothetical protein
MEIKGHGTKFGRKKEAAIAALLTQRNIEEAAKSVGISPTTLLSWTKVPEFQAAYREARRAAYSQAVARLQQGATAAATTLLKVMLDQGTPASVRVRAAECIMNHSSRRSRSKTWKHESASWSARRKAPRRDGRREDP